MKDTKTVTIRIRTELYDAIKKQADKENRTFNNMLETKLIEVVKPPRKGSWYVKTHN